MGGVAANEGGSWMLFILKKENHKNKIKSFKHCLESKLNLKINFPNKTVFEFDLKFFKV